MVEHRAARIPRQAEFGAWAKIIAVQIKGMRTAPTNQITADALSVSIQKFDGIGERRRAKAKRHGNFS